jgi:hypothetical protein
MSRRSKARLSAALFPIPSHFQSTRGVRPRPPAGADTCILLSEISRRDVLFLRRPDLILRNAGFRGDGGKSRRGIRRLTDTSALHNCPARLQATGPPSAGGAVTCTEGTASHPPTNGSEGVVGDRSVRSSCQRGIELLAGAVPAETRPNALEPAS